jgi:Na+-driven multidrug efflux pump
VPRSVAASAASGSMLQAETSADRLLMQLCMLPMIKLFTPLEAVQDAAKLPFVIASLSQVMNGVTFVGEGIMQGHRAFVQLAFNTALGCAVMLASLKVCVCVCVFVIVSLCVV